jgi:hypothetical protein
VRYLSILDVEQGLKRGIYRFFNQADGSALVWDGERRQYVGHVELPRLQQEAEERGLDLKQWVGYGQGSGWGSDGW